jgi:hypothetical protein
MKRGTSTRTVALTLAVVALAALLPAREAAAGLVPAFALELDGKTLRLADFARHPIVPGLRGDPPATMTPPGGSVCTSGGSRMI